MDQKLLGETHEDHVYLAKLAEQAERYDDMVAHMKKVAHNCTSNITVEERNLLSVAYKNVIGARRASWRVLTAVVSKDRDHSEGKGEGKESSSLQLVEEYKKKVEEELVDMCEDVLDVIATNLRKKTTDENGSENWESEVFYDKMSGDYYRYIAEVKTGDEEKDAAASAADKYAAATKTAKARLDATHPIRLGLALNYSVFYYEILQEHTQACEIAKQAFDSAIAELDKLPEDSYKDATLIMQLLRDNLTLWTTDQEDVDN